MTFFCKKLEPGGSVTPRWPLTPHLLRSHVWLYPRIIVSKSYENTSKYVDTVTLFAKTRTKGHWPLDDLWPHVCWGLMCDSTQGSLCPSPMGIHQCMWLQWSTLQITTYILHTYYIIHTTYRISDHIVSLSGETKMMSSYFGTINNSLWCSLGNHPQSSSWLAHFMLRYPANCAHFCREQVISRESHPRNKNWLQSNIVQHMSEQGLISILWNKHA